MELRKERVYVIQWGRFEDDVQFWRQRLGSDAEIGTIYQGDSLRFYLLEKQDFETFKHAIDGELTEVAFLEAPATNDEEAPARDADGSS